MRISVELVPRGEAEVHADARLVHSVMPAANTFNIPDLVRFPLRSWDACAVTKAILPASIPHIRAIDISPGQELPLANMLVAAGIAEVLVIQGDPPADLSRRTYPRSSAEIIRSLKRHHPALTVYAGFDPYRRSFRDEMAAVTQKIEAGADGFFTQPLFDVRLLEICAEMLRNLSVFWGIAPVLGERSRAYWETRNRVVFPSSFVPTLGWNRDFAISAVSAIRALNSNVYFMPIKVDLAKYLDGLVSTAPPATGVGNKEI